MSRSITRQLFNIDDQLLCIENIEATRASHERSRSIRVATVNIYGVP